MKYQEILDNYKKINSGERVVIYGAGIHSFSIFVHNDLSGINVIGVADKKFENRINQKFFNIPAFPPNELNTLDFDTLFVFMKNPEDISEITKSLEKAGKKIVFFNDTKIPFEKYNKIILVENGIERTAAEQELPAGINLTYTDLCRNNILKIELPHNLSNIKIHFQSTENCYCEVLSTVHILGKLDINFGQGSDMKIKIGRNISVISGIINTNQSKSEIEIGEDCMLASNVQICGTDGHSICDTTTGKLINMQKNKLHIGNHVWIGDNARLLKNSSVPDGCVVGANAVVTKKFTEQNSIIAGNPAKVSRSNIYWDRRVITSTEQRVSPEELN